jgi:DNA-binding IclR family transcriptional regulator
MDSHTLSTSLLVLLVKSHEDHTTLTLDVLAQRLNAPREAVRAVVTALHAEGYLDAMRLRLTLKGFAAGQLARGKRAVAQAAVMLPTSMLH